MREKMNQMFKDKLFLVMLVLGLLTIVAAAGVVRMQNGGGEGQNPYVDMQEQGEFLAGESNARENVLQETLVMSAEEETPEEASEEDSQRLAAGENPDTAVTEELYEAAREEGAEAQAVGVVNDAAQSLVLNFTDTSKLLWPIRGNIILDYDVESTIYFPTLDQYKCNHGLVIQGEVSDPVYAPANARVLEVGSNEEIGNYLTLDLGNEYSVVCGQLKEVAVVPGEYLERGQLLGYVAEPTKYYTIEGSNLFLEMRQGENTVDPLDYLE